jgi:uncharacterized protein DUF5681
VQGDNVLERDDIKTTDDCRISEVRPGGRFQTGQSGNPAGRPRGSRNKVTLKPEGMLAENADAIMEVLVKLAKEADLRAAHVRRSADPSPP